MSAHVKQYRVRHGVRLFVLGLAAAGLAGCSADAVRLSENPFSNPYARTASAPQASAPTQAVQTSHVDSQPLPPPQTASLPLVSSAGATGRVSYAHASYGRQAPDVTGSVNAPRPAGGWSWNGGTPVTVEAGDTVDSLARRYGVPAAAIMQANNLTSAAQVRPGQRLVIPRYDQAPAAGSRFAAKPEREATSAGSTHVVQSGETLSSLGRKYGKSRVDIARANNLPFDAQIRIGQQVVIPGVRVSQKPAAAPPKPAAQAVATSPAATASVQKVAANEPAASARMASHEPAADPEPAQATTGGAPSFRWPARGRVIAGFGPKPNGQQNDGINLAVPEGTSIKAADDGVVAYAGSELKGYGNLVLVRHSGGYVTAYAHASELLVKRGDNVKRGQTIGRAGQTGNVSSPQLHFEIRKGKDPVDPMQYLAGG